MSPPLKFKFYFLLLCANFLYRKRSIILGTLSKENKAILHDRLTSIAQVGITSSLLVDIDLLHLHLASYQEIEN